MSKKSQKLLIVLLCVICFGAGVSVPIVLNKTALEPKEVKFTCILYIKASDGTELGNNEIKKYNYRAKYVSYENNKTKLTCKTVQDCINEIDNMLEVK